MSVDKAPSGPNPYLALVPDPAALDYSGWERYADRQGEVRAELDRVVTSPILVDEDEPANTWLERQSRSGRGRPGLRPRARDNHQARILGTMSPEQVEIETVPANVEDDGSIPLAGETGIGTERDGIFTSATIGDGPHGSGGAEPDRRLRLLRRRRRGW